MKKWLLGILGIACCAALFGATGPTTPEGWLDDSETAFETAKEKQLPVLLLLTGSDWCPYCVKLKRNALDKSEFKAFAKDNLILVYADFPDQTKLPEKLAAQNNELAKKFGVRGFPTTIVLSPDGKELGRIVGYAPDYLEQVKALAAKAKK